jgi:hypothetical protein
MLAVADVYWKDFLASVAWAALVFYHDCCYMGAHCAYLHAHLNLELSGRGHAGMVLADLVDPLRALGRRHLEVCHTVVTLLSHCCYSVVTLLLHCCCTVNV